MASAVKKSVELKSIEKRIAIERKELIEYFNNTEDKLALKLIDHASFMRVTLQDLEAYINENGVKEDWTNGTNQYGVRECVESKTYKDMIKNYTAVIKQLSEMIKVSNEPSEKQKRLNAFKEF